MVIRSGERNAAATAAVSSVVTASMSRRISSSGLYGSCSSAWEASRDIRAVVRSKGAASACGYYQLYARFYLDENEECP